MGNKTIMGTPISTKNHTRYMGIKIYRSQLIGLKNRVYRWVNGSIQGSFPDAGYRPQDIFFLFVQNLDPYKTDLNSIEQKY